MFYKSSYLLKASQETLPHLQIFGQDYHLRAEFPITCDPTAQLWLFPKMLILPKRLLKMKKFNGAFTRS